MHTLLQPCSRWVGYLHVQNVLATLEGTLKCTAAGKQAVCWGHRGGAPPLWLGAVTVDHWYWAAPKESREPR